MLPDKDLLPLFLFQHSCFLSWIKSSSNPKPKSPGNASGGRKLHRILSMDSSSQTSNTGRKPLHYYILRLGFFFFFSLVISFLFSFACGCVAVVIGNFFVSTPAFVDAQCKIVSSGVDLMSAKVCELGVFNYKAKSVGYPFERRKFRCRYDYYWASVFKVEYRETSSARTHYALAEAPKEALPLDCRPSFSIIWLTKDKFKVNGTYNCRYVRGSSKVDIYSDSLFNCRAQDPSAIEMIQSYCIIFMRTIYSMFTNTGRAQNIFQGATMGLRTQNIFQGAAIGVIVGILFFGFFINLIRLIHWTKLKVAGKWNSGKSYIAFYSARFRRPCFLVVYVSVMSWLIIKYGELLGIAELSSQLLFLERDPER